jgi:hypothetical protein
MGSEPVLVKVVRNAKRAFSNEKGSVMRPVALHPSLNASNSPRDTQKDIEGITFDAVVALPTECDFGRRSSPGG